ncbi:unnamed protein product [Symbiodinium sp. CCMP2592]|nr:unnamed protein product [Symbiodinium sp. CCMP2592]
MAKLLFRHEDQLGINKSERFIMFFKRESHMSLVTKFVQKSEHWHEMREQKDNEINLPLRSFLFRTLLDELLSCLQKVTQSKDQLSHARQLQLFPPSEDENAELLIPFLVFNQDGRRLETLADRTPIPLARMVEILEEMKTALLLSAFCASTPRKSSLPPSDRLPDQGGSHPVPASAAPLAFLAVAANRPLSSLGTDGSLPPGHRDAQDAPASLSVPSLLHPDTITANTCNHCYANSVLLSLCWSLSFLPSHEVYWTAAMQSVMQRMRTQARLPDLWSKLHWTLLHSDWLRPHQQHDIAEYLVFVRRLVIPNLLAGGWQCCLSVSSDSAPPAAVGSPLPVRFQVRDRGVTWPLFVPEPPSQVAANVEGTLTLQKLINSWSLQTFDGATALLSEPRLLAVQVNRFNEGSSRQLHHTVPVTVLRTGYVYLYQHD